MDVLHNGYTMAVKAVHSGMLIREKQDGILHSQVARVVLRHLQSTKLCHQLLLLNLRMTSLRDGCGH